MLAQTEIIAAHAESAITSYEEAGLHGVDVDAEVLTAGYGVCDRCLELERGGPYTLERARGMIPDHPNCRCSLTPRVTHPGNVVLRGGPGERQVLEGR